jgi:hypothetical protein
MSTGASDRIGILVIRAWLEGPDQRLIVRIMKTSDVANQSVTVTVAGTAEDVSATVRAWLEEVRGPRSLA